MSKKKKYSGLLWPEYKGKSSHNSEYSILGEKFTIVRNLLELLKNTKNQPLPSKRVAEFGKLLKAGEDKLKSHRDSHGVRYTRNCFIGIAMILTGILPGLIALLATSLPKGKSPLFFAQAKGKQFADEAHNSKLKNTIN